MDKELKTEELGDGVGGGGEVVQITKSQLEGIISKLNSLENRGAVKKPKRVTEHTALLRFHEGKPVVWYGNIREKLNKDTGKLVAWMDIKLLDSEKILTVPYLEFLNTGNAVQVRILSQKAEEVVQTYGTFRAENPDPAKISGRNFNPTEVESTVSSYKYTSEVEVIDGEHAGKQFTVSNDCLNS